MQRVTRTLAATAALILIKPAVSQNLAAADLPAHYTSVPLKARAPQQALGASSDRAAQAALAPTIPMWTSTTAGYTYSMVGQNPQFPLSNQTTSILAPVVPVIVTFSDGTVFDPTKADFACLNGNNATGLTTSSPLFSNLSFNAGSVNVGTTQYVDFFQRANFWQYTNPGGVNPNYHVLLSPSFFAPVRITVPAASGRVVSAGSCGGKLGEIDINWFDNYLTTSLFPQLASVGLLPSNFPIFLTNNVILYDSTPSNCCILGYHSGFYNPSFGNAIQTYAFADFDSSGAFGANTRDVAALSHEIAEWMDDPLGDNPAPPWGHTGQVSGCQSDLEVGDPLSGTAIQATLPNGFTYHLQELAFFSWFYGQVPSLAVNGWYSSNGTFRSPATPCGTTVSASTTALIVNPTIVTAGTSSSVNITVSPASGSGVPTGSVTLTTSLGSTVGAYTLTNGSVATTATFLATGTYTVTAHYGGDTRFSASDSSPVTLTVGTPKATLNPSGLTFASQTVGMSSSAQTITLTNTGNAPLSGISVSLTGANPGDFAQTNNCPSSLAVNANCTLFVTFKPTVSGTRAASVSFADNAAGSPQTVTLTGTGAAVSNGAPTAVLGASSLTFPSQNVGSASTGQAVTLSNTGTASLTGIAISISGANPQDFSQTTNCSATLAVGTSCSLSVIFTPTASGPRSASISIADNATGSPQTVTLTGTGAASTPQLQPWLNSIFPFVVHVNQPTTLTVGGGNFQPGFTASLTTSTGTVQIPSSKLTFVNQGQVQIAVTMGGTPAYVPTLTITNPGGLQASSYFVVTQ